MVDLSGAHRLRDAALAGPLVRRSTPGAWSYGLPGGPPGRGPPDREPRLLRDRGAARARRRCATSSTGDVVVDAKSGDHRRRPRAQGDARTRAPCSRTSRRTPSARTGTRRDRAGARLPGLLRAASAAGAPRPARDVLRPHRRRRARRCSRPRTPAAPVVRVLPEGVTPEIARVQGTDAAEIGVFADRATGTRDRDLRARQPRQGRRRAGGAEREPRARAAPRRPACGFGRSWYERHRGQGLRRVRRARPASAGATGSTSRSSARSPPRDRRGDVHAQPRPGAPACRSTASTSRSPSRRRS